MIKELVINMNKKIIGGALAISLLAGGFFASKAFASNNSNNNNFQNPAFGRFGGMMGGKFGGMMGGNFGVNNGGNFEGNLGGIMGGRFFGNELNNLTEDQKTQLKSLQDEIRTARENEFNEMQTVRTEVYNAIEAGDKNAILTAYNKMTALRDKKVEELKPLLTKVGEILGKDVSGFEPNFENSYMQEKIDALKKATTDAEIKAAIDALKTPQCGPGFGFGGRGRGMMKGFGRF